MAKFTSPLQDQDTDYRSIGPSQRGGSGGEIAQVLSQGMSIFGEHMARQDAIKQRNQEKAERVAAAQAERDLMLQEGRAIGKSMTGILDLEDQITNQRLQSESIQNQAQAIAADGITPEEENILKKLKAEAARLDLLDSRQAGIRYRALQKQALADVDNLGIQKEINAIFSQGRSSELLKDIDLGSMERDGQEVKMKQFMDGKYGVNNYDSTDIGREKAKINLYNHAVESAKIDINVLGSNIGQIGLEMGQDAMLQAATLMQNQGHVRDDQKAVILANLDNGIAKSRSKLLELNKHWAKQGIDVTQQTKSALDELNSTASLFKNVLTGEGAFGDNVRTTNVLNNAVQVVDQLRKLNSPVATGLFKDLMGGGAGGGEITSALQVLSIDEELLQMKIDQTPGIDLSTSEVRTALLRALKYGLDPAGLLDAVNEGYIADPLAKIASSNFGLPNADQVEQVTAHMDVINEGQEATSLVARLDVFTDPKSSKQISTYIKSPEVVKRLEAVGVSSVNQILAEIKFKAPSVKDAIFVSVNGDLVIREDVTYTMQGMMGAANRPIKINQGEVMGIRTYLNALNKYLKKWGPAIGGKEAYTKLLMDGLKDKPIETTADEQ